MLSYAAEIGLKVCTPMCFGMVVIGNRAVLEIESTITGQLRRSMEDQEYYRSLINGMHDLSIIGSVGQLAWNFLMLAQGKCESQEERGSFDSYALVTSALAVGALGYNICKKIENLHALAQLRNLSERR